MQIVLDSAVQKEDYQQVFFDRPVRAAKFKNLAVLAGAQTSLYELERLFAITRAMGHHLILIADSRLKQLDVPADIYLSQAKSKPHYQNVDEAIELIKASHILLAGVGLEMNSAMQLLLDRATQSYQGPIVYTDQALKYTLSENYFSRSSMVFATTKTLLKFANKKLSPASETGLMRKVELLKNIFSGTGSVVVCKEDHQLIGLDFDRVEAGVVNSVDKIDHAALLAIFLNLLTDRLEPLQTGWLKYYFAAYYIYTTAYQKQKNPQTIKDFLEKQF